MGKLFFKQFIIVAHFGKISLLLSLFEKQQIVSAYVLVHMQSNNERDKEIIFVSITQKYDYVTVIVTNEGK